MQAVSRRVGQLRTSTQYGLDATVGIAVALLQVEPFHFEKYGVFCPFRLNTTIAGDLALPAARLASSPIAAAPAATRTRVNRAVVMAVTPVNSRELPCARNRASACQGAEVCPASESVRAVHQLAPGLDHR